MPRNAHAQVYVANKPGGGAGVVSTYTEEGREIKANFIVGLEVPSGLAVDGNNLFVADERGTVGKYNATTGAAINAGFITGLNDPIGVAVWGKTLFVANSGGVSVGAYDADTGKVINANFITGGFRTKNPAGLAVMGSILFVAYESGSIGYYSAETGSGFSNYISDTPYVFGLAVSGSNLFVTYPFQSEVEEYDTSGAEPVGGTVIGSYRPTYLAVSAGILFVNNGRGTIREYNIETGESTGDSLSGLSDPTGIAVK
jgi:hypothetical protein